MLIQQVINGLSCDVLGCENPEITSLSCDTTTVKPGCLFFCLKGKKYDGHKFFTKAIGDGAVAIVTEKPLDTSVLQIVVPDCRVAMSICAKNFYGNCADNLKLVAVVGTNGKTSTATILKEILDMANVNCGVIGTNGVSFNGQNFDYNLTTPDPIVLHKIFQQMYQTNVKVVVMEVSAHAIAFHKIFGLQFEVAVFTNFSQDHLDFFKTMQRYAITKKSFFCEQFVKNAIINVDDELGKEIYCQMPSVCYGIQEVADCFVTDVQLKENHNQFCLNLFGQKAKVKSKLVGKFNVYNILAASSVASVLGVGVDTIVGAVNQIKQVEGRNQTLMRRDGVRIVVDFAHTPDGFHNILTYIKSTTQGQLYLLFGCGGNRDKFKRPVMAQIASKFADFVVVTNDNPRYEDPRAIALDIAGNLTCPFKVILNRSQATEYVLSLAKSGDTIAILGKGDEKYQEIKGRKYPYSDVQVVQRLLDSDK